MHGVDPGLARVGIHIPAVLGLVLSPVGNLEALEDGTGTTVEADVTDALEEGVGVEVLGVDVMHHVRLLVELVTVHILDAEAYIIIKIKHNPLADKKKHDERWMTVLGSSFSPSSSVRLLFSNFYLPASLAFSTWNL